MSGGGGLNCGEHGQHSRRCPACVQIRAWYKAGDRPDHPPTARSADEAAHAALVVDVLRGQPVPVVAEWCATVLTARAGRWATFTGPQSVMTARFWAVAAECGEETGALLGRAA